MSRPRPPSFCVLTSALPKSRRISHHALKSAWHPNYGLIHRGNPKGSSVFVSFMGLPIALQRSQAEAKNSTRSEFLESNPASAMCLLSHLRKFISSLSQLLHPWIETVIVHTDCKLLSEAEIGLVRTKQVPVIDAIKTGRIATLVCSLFCLGSLQQSSWGTWVRTTLELSCPSEALSSGISCLL